MKTVRMLCIMVGSVLAAFLVPLAARAWLASPRPVEAPVMAADWDGRQKVSTNLPQTIGMHFYPAMAAQGENVYAMWSKLTVSGTTDYDPHYNWAGNYGGLWEWNGDIPVADTDNDTVNVDMAVDDTGGLHFVWTEATGTPDNYTLYYSYTHAIGIQEITGSDDEMVPAIAVGSGYVHVVWSQRSLEGSDERYDIMYRRKGSSGWSGFTTVRSSYDAPVGNPAIAVDGSGRVHVAWNEGDPGSANILYKNSSSNWSGTSITLSPNVTNESHGPALAVSGENVYAVWCERQDGDHQYVRFAQSTDGGSTWGDSERVSPEAFAAHSQAPRYLRPDIAVDSSGKIHVAFNGIASGNTYEDIYYVSKTSGASWWSWRWNVSDQPDRNSTTPAVAVSGDWVQVIWAEQRSGGQYEVIHRRGNPPQVEAVFLPIIMKSY